MGRHQTAEEVKQEYIEKLGDEFGNFFDRIRNEVIFLHFKWSEFEELYSKEDRIELMNKISPNFYFYLQNLLLDDVILGITRLTEPKSDRKGNARLTLWSFSNFTTPPLKGEVSKLLKRIKKEASFSYDRRNRKIAHFDKDLALNEHAKPLKIASREKINKVIDSIAELMNLIQGHYVKSETYYRVGSQTGYHLLLTADDGVRFQELKFKFYKEGKLDISDFDGHQ
tara:strand:- start:568 stop:1245 length:678 start_codon:yes stop_codon:yes gene_type:complete